MHSIILSAFLCLGGTVFFGGLITGVAKAQPPGAADLRTEKVVILLRHGVRAASDTPKLERYTGRTWPDIGNSFAITARSHDALAIWGRYHRNLIAQRGLIPFSGVLPENQVIAFSSSEERGRASADAFMAGFSPANPITVRHSETKHLFKPPGRGLHQLDPGVLMQVVSDALRMPLASARLYYRSMMEAFEAQLGLPVGPISHLPWEMVDGASGPHLEPLHLFKTMSETIRMQYANNMPIEDVGFGGVRDQAALARLMEIRSAYYDVMVHPRFFAVQRGGALLHRLSTTLSSDSPETVAIFMGHDGNVSSVRALLDFQFQAPEHVRNDVGPDGLLMFERVRNERTGERFVRISFHQQTMDQIRHLQELTGTTMPFTVMYEPSAQFNSPGENLIPLNNFTAATAGILAEVGMPYRTVALAPTITPTVTAAASPSPSVSTAVSLDIVAPILPIHTARARARAINTTDAGVGRNFTEAHRSGNCNGVLEGAVSDDWHGDMMLMPFK